MDYRVFEVNYNIPTPAHNYYNCLDYLPTNKCEVFVHHFASISGACP
ncbi:MAG: carbon starvation CstA family protein [Aquificaceae bacterium]|nr:carbon starvation CstA family protein [Aquificaceae bacterium]